MQFLPSLSALPILEAADKVIVHHSARLHVGVADGRADELEAALLEVADEGGGGAVTIAGGDFHEPDEVVVVVPVAVIKLNEADSAFGESAGEEVAS